MHPEKPGIVLKKSATETFLVTNLVNIRYLTGLDLSFGAVLITPRKWTLFTDSRYLEAAAKNVCNGFTVVDIHGLKKAMKHVERCGFEGEHLTVAQLKKWKAQYKNTKFVQTSGIIEFFRRGKDEGEIKKFRKAQRITQQVIAKIASRLKPGITERELAWKIHEWMVDLGAEELSFDSIVGFGSHTSSPHHHPTERKLKVRDIVQIDCGARYQGYCADQSALFFTGKPTSEQQKVYDAVKKAKDIAISAVQVGALTSDLDVLARTCLREDGYEQYFMHALGHGVGLDIHEGVTLSSKGKGTKLLSNEIITIEPGVYIPGKFGIRLEEEIIVA